MGGGCGCRCGNEVGPQSCCFPRGLFSLVKAVLLLIKKGRRRECRTRRCWGVPHRGWALKVLGAELRCFPAPSQPGTLRSHSGVEAAEQTAVQEKRDVLWHFRSCLGECPVLPAGLGRSHMFLVVPHLCARLAPHGMGLSRSAAPFVSLLISSQSIPRGL